MSKLNKTLQAVFINNPGVKKLLATEDGQCWLDGFQNLARDYARKKGLSLKEYQRADVMANAEGPDDAQEPNDDQKPADLNDQDEQTLAERAKAAINKGLDNNVLHKAGTWIKFGEDGLAQGFDNAVGHLMENTDILKSIEDALDRPETANHQKD